MVTGLIQGLLPTILLTVSLHSPYTPSATLQATNSAQISESRYYSVKEGDTLRTIAADIYGDEEYWSVLWNDNDWIEDPSLIEPTWKLKLRTIKPQLPKTVNSIVFASNALQNRSTQTPNHLTQQSPSVQTPVQPVSEPSPTPEQQAQPLSSSGPLSEAQITFLGNCESGMNPTTNTGNGFFGAFQFTIPTWNAMGTGFERADLAPLSVQMNAVQKLLSRSSIWTQFPGCAAKMRAAGLI